MITVKALKKALEHADDSAVVFISDTEDIRMAIEATTAAISDGRGDPIPAVIFNGSMLPISKRDEVSLYKIIAG